MRATTLLARIIDIKCTRIVDAHFEKAGLRVDVVPTTRRARCSGRGKAVDRVYDGRERRCPSAAPSPRSTARRSRDPPRRLLTPRRRRFREPPRRDWLRREDAHLRHPRDAASMVPRRRCSECRCSFTPSPRAVLSQRVCGAACRAARDRKLPRGRRRRDSRRAPRRRPRSAAGTPQFPGAFPGDPRNGGAGSRSRGRRPPEPSRAGSRSRGKVPLSRAARETGPGVPREPAARQGPAAGTSPIPRVPRQNVPDARPASFPMPARCLSADSRWFPDTFPLAARRLPAGGRRSPDPRRRARRGEHRRRRLARTGNPEAGRNWRDQRLDRDDQPRGATLGKNVGRWEHMVGAVASFRFSGGVYWRPPPWRCSPASSTLRERPRAGASGTPASIAHDARTTTSKPRACCTATCFRRLKTNLSRAGGAPVDGAPPGAPLGVTAGPPESRLRLKSSGNSRLVTARNGQSKLDTVVVVGSIPIAPTVEQRENGRF